MPAPKNAWSHYISVITQVQNRIIKEDFSDVGDDNWQPDIATPRGSLRVACTIRANDSAPIVLLRLMLYYIVLRKAQDLQIPVYGMPSHAIQAQRKFKPHVHLYFSQNALDVQKGDDPITGSISWRIMNESSSSISRSEVERLANKIKTEFGSGNGFVWRKGKKMVSYTDWDRGLQLQILSRDENEGERVIKKVLDVAGVTFEAKRCNLNKNKAEDSRYPSAKQRENILGESVELPRERPEVNVTFRYATLSLHGRKKPVHLYDKTLQLVDSIVR